MNDRDSNTRAFKMDSHLSNRALRERKRKKRQIVLITLMALLALSLIISVVVICGELAGGGSGTGTGDGTDNISAGVISNDTGKESTETPVSSDDPVITDAPETSGGISEGYTVKLMTSADIHRGELILVNTSYKYVYPASIAELVDLRSSRSAKWGTSASGKVIHSYSCSFEIKLTAATVKGLNDMIDDFYTATQNQDVYFPQYSGYRSSEEQNTLHDAKPASEDPEGCSEHHTGLAIDMRAWLSNNTYPYISQSDDPSCVQIYNWINTNCYKYGFVRRYPESKASVTKSGHYAEHYRYVGYPHALAMMRNDLTLEEYLTVLATRHRYDGTHYILNGDNGVTYEIYYVPAATGDEATTSVPVPMNLPYTVSGNNYDGFIVTVTRS